MTNKLEQELAEIITFYGQQVMLFALKEAKAPDEKEYVDKILSHPTIKEALEYSKENK